ncbi:hypothetical protein AB0C29_30295 [Actinoplanes sp. NPDC048791]|uniref:hypothetical protein n=1 Tax=Actinoplanes sp. NPDC048791 TaxID=3154623 RepID=UPI0033DAB483
MVAGLSLWFVVFVAPCRAMDHQGQFRRAALASGIPDDEVSRFIQLVRDLPHLDELCALANDLWPPDNGYVSACIGGYADEEVIGSIAEQTLAWREKTGAIVIPVAKWYSQVEKETHRLTSEWVSLARFPVDNELCT